MQYLMYPSIGKLLWKYVYYWASIEFILFLCYHLYTPLYTLVSISYPKFYPFICMLFWHHTEAVWETKEGWGIYIGVCLVKLSLFILFLYLFFMPPKYSSGHIKVAPSICPSVHLCIRVFCVRAITLCCMKNHTPILKVKVTQACAQAMQPLVSSL